MAEIQRVDLLNAGTQGATDRGVPQAQQKPQGVGATESKMEFLPEDEDLEEGDACCENRCCGFLDCILPPILACFQKICMFICNCFSPALDADPAAVEKREAAELAQAIEIAESILRPQGRIYLNVLPRSLVGERSAVTLDATIHLVVGAESRFFVTTSGRVFKFVNKIDPQHWRPGQRILIMEEADGTLVCTNSTKRCDEQQVIFCKKEKPQAKAVELD